MRRVPFIAQMENTECGAACLTMVLASYGHHAPLLEVRRAAGVTRDGANALDIVEAARGYGMVAKGVKTSIEGLRALPTPAILHWTLNHFVVLQRMTRTSARIVDPATGARDVSLAELSTQLTGVALVMTPGPDFEKRRRQGGALGRYAAHTKGALRPLATVLGATLLLEALGLLVPAANQVVLDTIIRPRQERLLWFVAGALAFAFVLRAVLAIVRERVLAGVRIALDVRLMASFVDKLTALPLGFFQQRSAGDLMSRVQANAALRDAVTTVASAALDCFLVLAYAALMLAYDRRLGGVVVALAALRVAIAALATGRARELVARELAASGREAEATHTALAYPEAVRAFHAAPLLASRHRTGIVARLNAVAERRETVERVGTLLPILDGASRMAVLWLGGNAVMHDQMTPGVFASFLAMQVMLTRPLAAVVGGVQQLQTLGQTLARLDDVLDTAPEANAAGTLPALRGHVQIASASFTYGTGKRAKALVDGIDLVARPGEMIAIVGPSGAGKTTLLNLLLGFIDPTAGAVRYDGVDVRDLDRAALRRQMGLVSQDAYFFDDTLRNNLKLWAPDASTEEIWDALDAACIDDVVRALPGGLDGNVGPGARNLSGGQRQRLSLARALVHRPSVLVLDEATSSLDLAVEHRVHENLRRLGCTRIVVAHRLQTVRDADRIYVLEGGRVVQVGSHRELLRDAKGLYARLEDAGAGA